MLVPKSHLKSDNLQYNTLGRWATLQKQRVLSAMNPNQQPTVLFSIYQNNTWINGHLVDETVDPVT